MAYGSSSSALRNCCDEFIDLSNKAVNTCSVKSKDSKVSNRTSGHNCEDKSVVKKIILDEFSKHGNKIMSSRLKERLLCLDSGFNENNFGYNSFCTFLQSLGFKVRIEVSTAYCFK